MIALTVNGKAYSLDVESETPLLWVIRDELGMTGTKFGCGIAQCRACTVHVDGEAVRSCSIQFGDGPTRDYDDRKSFTGREASGSAAWLAETFRNEVLPNPGRSWQRCFSEGAPKADDADIDANLTNICGCGTYVRIRSAIHRAAAQMKT